ncbi:hypothetical protein BD413DRAFT_527110 [Trametes elegans]|nr:hypothetical protein BD413DRAFT_527110 [Trametes elegans]
MRNHAAALRARLRHPRSVYVSRFPVDVRVRHNTTQEHKGAARRSMRSCTESHSPLLTTDRHARHDGPAIRYSGVRSVHFAGRPARRLRWGNGSEATRPLARSRVPVPTTPTPAPPRESPFVLLRGRDRRGIRGTTCPTGPCMKNDWRMPGQGESPSSDHGVEMHVRPARRGESRGTNAARRGRGQHIIG